MFGIWICALEGFGAAYRLRPGLHGGGGVVDLIAD
jgi:hypothetical protein